MSVSDLIVELRKIVLVHPEAADAQIWAYIPGIVEHIRISTVGYDRRHKPARIKLEE